jgi:hypothetical protein
MRIEVLQSGGVAGVQRPLQTIDTTTLPAEDGRKWQGLVAAADFFNLPAAPPLGPRRDSFSYRVTVEEDGRRHTIQTATGDGGTALDALIEHLRQAGIGTLKKNRDSPA